MQHHHPGSWYLPWGVPLQKMLMTIPHHPQAATVFHPDGQTQMPTSPTYPLTSATAAGQVLSQALVQQGPPPQTPHQQQQQSQSSHSPTNGHLSAHRPGHFQHHPMHPHHHAHLHPQHHHPHHHHPHHQHAQQMHQHAAAAAMFTPISLRSFLGHHQSHNMSAALSQAQPPANSPLGNASMPVGQMPTMSLNVGVIPMGGNSGGGGGRHSSAGGGGGPNGLGSPGLTLTTNQHNIGPTAAGASLLMPMKKVKSDYSIVLLLMGFVSLVNWRKISVKTL